MRKLFRLMLSWLLILGSADACLAWDRANPHVRIASRSMLNSIPKWEIALPVEYEARFQCLGSVNPNRAPGISDLPDTQTTGGAGSNSGDHPSGFRADSRLTIFPSLRACGLLGVAGKYTIHRWTSAPQPIFDDVVSSALYPGVPPFERYYDSKLGLLSGDPTEIGKLEEFRISVGVPEYCEFWTGSKDLLSGVRATRGPDNANEFVGLTIPWQKFKFTIGTGATLPHESSNTNTSASILYGPLVLLGCTGAYVVVNSMYAMVCFAVNGILDSIGVCLSSGEDDDSSTTRPSSCGSAYSSGETYRCETKSKKKCTGLNAFALMESYSIQDLTNDYSIVVGDRAPCDVFMA